MDPNYSIEMGKTLNLHTKPKPQYSLNTTRAVHHPSKTMTDTKPSTLMALPTEIRLRILHHLLSVDASIHTCPDYSSRLEYNMYVGHRLKGISWYDHCCHRHPCLERRELPSPAILRLNRRLYEEGTSILYACNFDINVTAAGFQFLQWGGQIGHIPEFPFHKAKQLTIKIMPPVFNRHALKLYINLATLCSHIASVSRSLKKVHIVFHDEQERDPNEAYPRIPSWREQQRFVTREALLGYCDREPYASILGTILDSAQGISAFEWCLQPLGQLPLAEECSIEIPCSVRGNERATMLSQQCAKSITRRTTLARPGEQEARQIGYAMRQYPYGFEPGIRLWGIRKMPLWRKIQFAMMVFKFLLVVALFFLFVH